MGAVKETKKKTPAKGAAKTPSAKSGPEKALVIVESPAKAKTHQEVPRATASP